MIKTSFCDQLIWWSYRNNYEISTAEQAVLRHTSAYDEMIGAAEKTSHNTLEVPLKDNQLY